MGAVKYADLSVSHDSEYIFDYDRMLAFTGNTGPYMQYATARIRSIFRKGGVDPAEVTGPIILGEPAERDLALQLLGFGAVIEHAAAAASRTGSAPTSSRPRARSPRSTRSARCCGTTSPRRPGPRVWRCAR